MIIYSQTKNKIVNFDNIDLIVIDEEDITAYFNDGSATLGSYNDEDECRKVLESILYNYTAGRAAFVMPQKGEM